MNSNYLNYYNAFEEFDAGAGIKEKELFTEEQQLSFLPKTGMDNANKLYFSIVNNNDLKSLLALIMLVIAISIDSLIAIIFIIISAIFISVPGLIIAYCIAIHLKYPDNAHLGVSFILMVVSGITIYLAGTSRISSGVKRITDIILLVILGVYMYKIYTPNTRISASIPRKTNNTFQTYSNY